MSTTDLRERAPDLIRRFLRAAPIALDRIVRVLGLSVAVDPKLSPGISSRIEVQGPRVLIIVNGSHAPQRQRFTLAHAIAHCVLHRAAIGTSLVEDAHRRGAGLTAEMDEEADRYAADLLMPADLVHSFWNLGVRSASEMARRFDVTPEAATARMGQLGIG
ncbi:MAG TPA: ImmA/IrrE family metallo-endopeptidase [Acetobacteraceae bacterium]|nr:ImmA/IrrE family metallo-endopeptidase [Acetobacteraceae bacterium]